MDHGRPAARGGVGTHGWRADPFGRFDQRYFSQGEPTALVRSGRVEARDEPVGDDRGDGSEIGQLGTAAVDVIEDGSCDDAAPVASELADPVSAEHPVIPVPVLYEHRDHPVAAALVVVLAAMVPLTGWLVLVPTPGERVFSAIVFVVVVVALGLLCWAGRRRVRS